MNLVLIRTFLAIVETGSLVNASRFLNTTQSTVTSRLKSLEDDLGQTLLHRQKSGIVLTSAGFKFRRYAEAMSNLWHQALLETSLPKGMESICNMACDPDLWPMLGRKLAHAIRQTRPTTALSFWHGDQNQIESWFVSGLIDCAISYHSSTLHGVTSHKLEEEQLNLFTTRKGSPMRADPDYVYFHASAEFGRDHAAEYSDAGVAKNSFGAAVWVLDHLLDYGGSAYLPNALAAPALKQGKLFPIDDAPVFSRSVYLITNDIALKGWPWLPELALELKQAGRVET